MENTEYRLLLQAIRDNDDDETDRLLLKLLQEKENASKNDQKNWQMIKKQYYDALGLRAELHMQKLEKSFRNDSRYMTGEKLTEAANDKLFGHIYQEEIDRRENERLEEKEKEEKKLANIESIINFHEIYNITDISYSKVIDWNDTNGSLVLPPIPFRNIKFIIKMDKNGITIISSDGRILTIKLEKSLDTVTIGKWEDGDVCTTKLTFTYSYDDKKLNFEAITSCAYRFESSYEDLVRYLHPVDNNNKALSWDFAKKRKKMFFNKQELQFIEYFLNETIEILIEKNDQGEEVERRVFHTDTKETTNKVLRKLKENK